jgi:calcineurin-like phosphoesterase family protein
MIWFTADTHFHHAAVIDYCKRPFSSVEEMDEAMVAAWNARVSKTDIV